MKRFILAPLAILSAWLCLAISPASAQNIYPYQAPRYGPGWQTPLSPYLNLLLPGNTAVNYYGLVEPLFQGRQFQNVTGQTIQGMLNQIPQPPGIFAVDLDAPMTATGHPTMVNYTGSYFGTLTGQPFVGEGGMSQRRGYGASSGMMGAGGAGMMRGMGGMMGGTGGMGGMMGGMMGGSGIWPNMRPGMTPR